MRIDFKQTLPHFRIKKEKRKTLGTTVFGKWQQRVWLSLSVSFSLHASLVIFTELQGGNSFEHLCYFFLFGLKLCLNYLAVLELLHPEVAARNCCSPTTACSGPENSKYQSCLTCSWAPPEWISQGKLQCHPTRWSCLSGTTYRAKPSYSKVMHQVTGVVSEDKDILLFEWRNISAEEYKR